MALSLVRNSKNPTTGSARVPTQLLYPLAQISTWLCPSAGIAPVGHQPPPPGSPGSIRWPKFQTALPVGRNCCRSSAHGPPTDRCGAFFVNPLRRGGATAAGCDPTVCFLGKFALLWCFLCKSAPLRWSNCRGVRPLSFHLLITSNGDRCGPPAGWFLCEFAPLRTPPVNNPQGQPEIYEWRPYLSNYEL